jgi:hypothetical protein
MGNEEYIQNFEGIDNLEEGIVSGNWINTAQSVN